MEGYRGILQGLIEKVKEREPSAASKLIVGIGNGADTTNQSHINEGTYDGKNFDQLGASFNFTDMMKVPSKVQVKLNEAELRAFVLTRQMNGEDEPGSFVGPFAVMKGEEKSDEHPLKGAGFVCLNCSPPYNQIFVYMILDANTRNIACNIAENYLKEVQLRNEEQ